MSVAPDAFKEEEPFFASKTFIDPDESISAFFQPPIRKLTSTSSFTHVPPAHPQGCIRLPDSYLETGSPPSFPKGCRVSSRHQGFLLSTREVMQLLPEHLG